MIATSQHQQANSGEKEPHQLQPIFKEWTTKQEKSIQ